MSETWRHLERGSSRVGGLRRVHSIRLVRIDDERGSLCVAEAGVQVPFEIRRVFWIFNASAGAERAHHAHRELQQMLVAVAGSFTVNCDDGANRTVHQLRSPEDALLLPEMVWHHLTDFSEGALCLVLVSGPYDPAEKILDYDEFLQLTAKQ